MLIDDLKAAHRISEDDAGIVGELADIIEAAKIDLELSGIAHGLPDNASYELTVDPIIRRAIITYSKWQFGMDNPDSEKYHAAYELLKAHLALAPDYRAVEEVV